MSGVLHAMHRHFPELPGMEPAVRELRHHLLNLDPWAVKRIEQEEVENLLYPAIDRSQLVSPEGPMQAAPFDLLFELAANCLQAAVDANEDMYRSLYHLLICLRPDQEDALATDDSVFTAQGQAAIDERVRLALADLCYNPLRTSTWDFLSGIFHPLVSHLAFPAYTNNHKAAETFKGAVRLMLEGGCRKFTVQQWRQVEEVRATYTARLHQAMVATVVVQRLTPEASDAAYHEEQLGMLLYDGIRDAPPCYDQLGTTPVRDQAYLNACEKAAEASRLAKNDTHLRSKILFQLSC